MRAVQWPLTRRDKKVMATLPRPVLTEDGVAARMRGRGVSGKWRLGKKFKCFDYDEDAKKWLSGGKRLSKWQILKRI